MLFFCALLTLCLTLGAQPAAVSEARFDYLLKLDPNDPKAYDKDNQPQFGIPWRSLDKAVRWARDLWDAEYAVKLTISGGPWYGPIEFQDHKTPHAMVLEAASPSVILDGSLSTNRPFMSLLETRNMVVRGFSFTNPRAVGATVWLRNCRNILFDRVTGLSAESIRMDRCEQITFRGCGLSDSALKLPQWVANKNIHIEASPANP
jgi:hypothetical protein